MVGVGGTEVAFQGTKLPYEKKKNVQDYSEVDFLSFLWQNSNQYGQI